MQEVKNIEKNFTRERLNQKNFSKIMFSLNLGVTVENK
jgi:hypothetical protein